jgi:uncharacterized protein YoxC
MLLMAGVPQAAAARDWLDTVVGVASALNTLLLLAILLVIAPAMWSFIKSLRQLRALLDRVYDDLKPLTTHANRIAANVDEITDSVKTEVQRVTQSIAQANEGISRAIESTDRRLSKLGALMDVAQQEAEKLLVSTAAAVEGVKAGARAASNDGDSADDARPERPRVRSRKKGRS